MNFKIFFATALVALLGGGALAHNICFAQSDYPNLKVSPAGVYIFCGNEIPKDFYYKIFKFDNNTNVWNEFKILKFSNNKDDFFNELPLFNSQNAVYQLPNDEFKNTIWDYIQKFSSSDSIPFYGGIPMYLCALKNAALDNNIVLGQEVKYKIIKVSGEGIAIDSAIKSIVFNKINPNFAIKSIDVKAQDNRITINFKAEALQDIFSAKAFRRVFMQSDFIESSAFIGVSTIGDEKIISLIDTSIVPNIAYEYFIEPVDLFGNAGNSSDTVKIINIESEAKLNVRALKTVSVDSLRAVKLSWSIDAPQYLSAIDIYRADSFDGKYARIASLKANDTAFIDRNVSPIVSYYYYIVLNSAFGASKPSARIAGLLRNGLPPQPVLDFSAQNYGNLVKLAWRKPTNDSRAYYIYRAELNRGGDFRAVEPLFVSDSAEIVYIDSLKNISDRTLAYFVKTENTSGKISEPSDTLQVFLELNIEPKAPINFRAVNRENSIVLIWDPVNEFENKDIDYRIYKKTIDKTNGASQFAILGDSILSGDKNYFEDFNIINGGKYEYKIQSVARNNRLSQFTPAVFIARNAFAPLAISNVSIEKADSNIIIAWNPTAQLGVKKYKIYRALEKGAPELIATINDININSFIDKNAPINHSIFYSITCVDDNGIESDIDEWHNYSPE